MEKRNNHTFSTRGQEPCDFSTYYHFDFFFFFWVSYRPILFSDISHYVKYNSVNSEILVHKKGRLFLQSKYF